jgi:hypothetical protein
MNRKTFILLSLFILSRVIFINPLPVFFDSPEYLLRFSNPNFIQAVVSGHMPFHPGYIALFWPIFQIGRSVGANPAYAVILTQIFFSTVAIYCFYLFLRMIANNRIAAITTIISSLTPLYWTMNDSIMTESTCINYFFISLYFLTSHIKNKTNSRLYLIVGSALFGLAILTNPLTILWTPFILSIVYFLKKEKFMTITVSIVISATFAILTNSFLIAYFLHTPFQRGIYQYLFGIDIKIIPSISTPTVMILRSIRNGFIPILQNNTAIILFLSVISLIKIFNVNRKMFIIICLWILPSIFTNQLFDPLLLGRHGAISGFGLALLAAIFLEKRKILFYIVVVYIFLVSVPALNLLRQPIPYLEMGEFDKTLPKGLLIESHFARPQVSGHYSGKIIFINEPGWDKQTLMDTINEYLRSKIPVYITSQALSEPYGLYSGPFLHPLSLAYLKKFELEDVISLYTIKKYRTIDEDAGLIVYEIIYGKISKYFEVPRLSDNRHRIDYFDPAIRLWSLIERASIIQSQNIIKG